MGRTPDPSPTGRGIDWIRVVFIATVLVAAAFATQVRLSRFAEWKQDPDRHFFAGGRPLLTSADGYFWTRLAEEYRDGVYDGGGKDALRNYPDGARKPRPVPLLSFLIAGLSSATGADAFTVGSLLIPVLAGLFLFPLAFYFDRIGLPAAGLLGGLVAAFSHQYMARTSIGGVDTDALVLFFPVLGSLFVLRAGEAESERQALLFSALTGLAMLLFYWWYFHAGFTVVYLALLVACLLLRRARLRRVLYCAALYVLASNPLWFARGFRGLSLFLANTVTMATSDPVGDAVRLPAILPTVTEFQRETPWATLGLVLDSPPLVLGGLAAFAVLAVRRWRDLLPFLPLPALAMLAFGSGRRFAVFLAPLVGIGYGWLLTLLLRRLFARWRRGDALRRLAPCAASVVVFALLWGMASGDYRPRPWLGPSTPSAIVRLRDRLPPNAAVMTWWDYGYLLAGLGRFASYHDGSSHGLLSYLIARGLSAESQEELYATAAYINDHGQERIRERLARSPSPQAELRRAVEYEGTVKADDVYLLFLDAMVPKYAAIHYLGAWDLERGVGEPHGYQKLRCSDWSAGRITCEEGVIDAETGRVRDGVGLERIVFIRDGREVGRTEFPAQTGLHLQVLTSEAGVAAFYLLDDEAFRSNFNRMFFLGQHDPSLFEEVVNDFPRARVFRFRGRDD